MDNLTDFDDIGKTAGKVPGKVVGKVAGKVPGKVPDKTAGKVPASQVLADLDAALAWAGVAW